MWIWIQGCVVNLDTKYKITVIFEESVKSLNAELFFSILHLLLVIYPIVTGVDPDPQSS